MEGLFGLGIYKILNLVQSYRGFFAKEDLKEFVRSFWGVATVKRHGEGTQLVSFYNSS